MRFVILLPTIRDHTGGVFAALHDSLTQPTDVFVLRDIHGQGEGHSQALNYAVSRLIDPARHTIAVKMDDDLLLSRGWQDDIVQAFADIPNMGICGLDVSHTPDGHTYMIGGMAGRQMIPFHRYGKTRYGNMPVGNVGGVLIASPAALMQTVGDVPIVDNEKYPFFADGWYNKMVRERGYRIGYITPRNPVTMTVHDDPKSYLDGKEADTARIYDAAMEIIRK